MGIITPACVTRIALILIVLFCPFVGMFGLNNYTALAQEQVTKTGELTGGRSETIPIQLKAGEMVKGELVAVRNQNLELSIADSSGKAIKRFDKTSTRMSFKYAPKVGGQYYVVVANPDSWSIGTSSYRLIYSIMPADIPPEEPPLIPPEILAVIIAVIVIGGIMFLVITMKRKRAKHERELYRYGLYGRWEKYSIPQLEHELLRIKNKNSELQQRFDSLARARTKVKINIDIGTGNDHQIDEIDSLISHVNRQMEELDREEEGIRQVLRDKNRGR